MCEAVETPNICALGAGVIFSIVSPSIFIFASIGRPNMSIWQM